MQKAPTYRYFFLPLFLWSSRHLEPTRGTYLLAILVSGVHNLNTLYDATHSLVLNATSYLVHVYTTTTATNYVRVCNDNNTQREEYKNYIKKHAGTILLVLYHEERDI